MADTLTRTAPKRLSTLDKWLQGPQKVVPGTRMFFSVSNPAERAAIIAYLRSDAAK